MEQRIGSSSRPLKAEPVTGAGFDPAYIPGLTAPASAQPEDARQQKTGKPSEAEDAPSQDAAPAEEPAEEPGTKEQSEEQPVDGPVFEAADRRARIVADHRGVHLSLDDQECEFRWDEIAAVETATSRFGKRFTVVVHTPEQRWYPIEIDAPARSRFAEWEKQLDAVLDAYFEDGEAEDKGDRGDRDEKDGDGRSEADKDTADESPAAGS
ncbi:hypothetical protein [Streptomyces thermovulgaris]|uniref:hypothetical protein n=1 Tax=Streptomyces thermovulgaris TaxID=1934 RepID=UPI000A3A1B10|nr:hypothetical protein [Streptomyces thermovulgaris]